MRDVHSGSDGHSGTANNNGHMVPTAFTMCAMSYSDHATASEDCFTFLTGMQA